MTVRMIFMVLAPSFVQKPLDETRMIVPKFVPPDETDFLDEVWMKPGELTRISERCGLLMSRIGFACHAPLQSMNPLV